MAVLDPFSAASKPMPDWDSIPSQPLPFAATLHGPNDGAQDVVTQHLPRPRRHPNDGFPTAFPPPAYGHVRHGSLSSSRVNRASVLFAPRIGSDEWMQGKVAECVDKAKSSLDLSDKGLERLSTKISDLRDLVTLSSVHSPTASPSQARTPSGTPLSPRSPLPLPGHRALSSERTFSRTQSAPASTFFRSLARGDSATPSRGGGSLLAAAPIFEASSPTASPDQSFDSDNLSVLDSPRASPRSSPRAFTRSKTGFVNLTESRLANIELSLARNSLTSLPSALFEIRNLTVLSLRGNQLTSLPAAIGELVNLVELNIGINKIKYLPSTILHLTKLQVFHTVGNPWLEKPATDPNAPVTLSSMAARVLSPLQSHQHDSPVPRLSSLCLSVLLSPHPDSNNLPPFFCNYDWDERISSGSHPLLDPNLLQQFIPCLQLDDLGRILQAVRSGCAAATQAQSSANGLTQSLRLRRSSQPPRIDPFPRSHAVPEPDDASTNPYYYPCPSPRHRVFDEDAEDKHPTRRLFLHPAEERFEWVDVAGAKGLPIQWLGCSPGCLAFLEEEEEEEWGLGEEDGFGAEVLEEADA